MRTSILSQRRLSTIASGFTHRYRSLQSIHTPAYNMAPAQSESQPVPDRTSFTAKDSVEYIWKHLGLPAETLDALDLKDSGPGFPSSFKIADLAQASIGLSALLAAQIYALRTASPVPAVDVPRQHAVIEFKSERLYTLAGQPAQNLWGPLSGLHKTSDGHVRVHDGFPNHSNGATALLRCPPSADRPTVSAAIAPGAPSTSKPPPSTPAASSPP
jgi:hypothetical protein